MDKNILRILIYLGIIILFVGTIAIFPKIFSSHELLFQVIAVVLSVLFTAVVTNTLLTAQSKAEESKEKSIKNHESRIKAYSRFTKKMWGVLDDEIITEDEIFRLRTELFDNLIFHLDRKQLAVFTRAIGQLYDNLSIAESNGSKTKQEAQRDHYIQFSTTVADCLKDYVNPEENDSKPRSIIKRIIRIILPPKEEVENEPVNTKTLWLSFSNIASFFPDEQGSEDILPGIRDNADTQAGVAANIAETEPLQQDGPEKLQQQSWHFSMWDFDQLDKLDEGFDELSLTEYGENWRTDLVKQIKKGDLIFLFKGRKQYAGVFRALGWRVFEYDEQRNVREQVSEGIEKKVVVSGETAPISAVAEKLQFHDFYKSFLDPNSSFCANVVVEPISYIRQGVPNPNTTYRKTISRYYEGYAVNLLKVFAENEEDKTKKEEILKLLA